jgi:hypothetical protein
MLVLAPGNTKSILDAFLAAADACVTKPFRPEDVVAQIGALVRMSRRIARAQKANPKAFTGDLAQVSLSTVLTIVGLEKRTGVFEVSSPDTGRASLEIISGHVTDGQVAGVSTAPVQALRTMMELHRGRFTFNVRPQRDPPMGAPALRELLLHVARLIDESGRTGGLEAKGRSGAPGT